MLTEAERVAAKTGDPSIVVAGDVVWGTPDGRC